MKRIKLGNEDQEMEGWETEDEDNTPFLPPITVRSVFLEQLETFRLHPTHDMGEILTESLMKIPDLREEEQTQYLEAVEALVCNREEETKVLLDETTSRLVEIISGKTVNYEKRDVLLQYARTCLGALTTGEDEIVLEAYRAALAYLGNPVREITAPVSFCQVAGLLDSVPELPSYSHKANAEQFQMFLQVFGPSAKSKGLVLRDAFEVECGKGCFDEPTLLLCHGTRSIHNLSSILSEGLQVKGNGGRLGKAIYCSDSLEKSLCYCGRTKLSDGQIHGIVFLVQVALGKVFDTTTCMAFLDKAPEGFDSVRALGQVVQAKSKRIVFSNGEESSIPVLAGQVKNSRFNHNEYTVYSPDRVRVRFMLLFSSGPSSDDCINRSAAPPNEVNPFEAYQLHGQFRKKLVDLRNSTYTRFGKDSPESKRVEQLLKEASEESSVEVFSKLIK